MKENYITAVLEELQAGKDTAEVLKGLQQTLESKGHNRLYGAILRGVLRVLEARGTSVATVTVVNEASYEKQKDAITAALNELGVVGNPEVITDATIIGGFIAEGENKRLDKSYKSRLVSLYRNLTK